MPITTAWIAYCCRVTSLYFWTLLNVSPAMWIPPMNKGTSYFLQWFYTFYSIKLKTSHPALLWDKIFIIFTPQAADKQKLRAQWDNINITFQNRYQLQISHKECSRLCYFILQVTHLEDWKAFLVLSEILPRKGNSCSAAAAAVLLCSGARRQCESQACTATSHSPILPHRKHGLQ